MARVMVAAAALTGCAVNSLGLDNVDAGDDADGPVDRPIDTDDAPTDGAGGGDASDGGGTDSFCRSCDSDTARRGM